MKKNLAVIAAVGLTAGLGTVATAIPAYAGSCGQVQNVSVRGGQASWSHSCANGNIRVSGWVKDTKADGKCAQVKAEYSNGTQWSNRACPKDEVERFDFVGPGNYVPVRLITVPTG